MSARVTVIIPTFNRGALIGQAVDSVLEQNYPDVEIIVVDDGSTDDTPEKLKAYGERIRYVRTANGGVAHARNVGTRHATGKYITYLDSDDLHYPYTLALQSALLDRLPEVSLICAEMSGFDDGGFFERYHLQRYHRSAYRHPDSGYDRIFERRARLADLVPIPETLRREDPSAGERHAYLGNVFDVYLVRTILCQNSVMLRAEILPSVGERNVRVRHWQEVDFLLRICRNHRVCFADVPTYKLRYHDGQISTTARSDGKRVWMRKQQILLRVTKRHALADVAYYLRHRRTLDRHLAHLHRAVAVPMMLLPAHESRRAGYGARARAYLAKCRQYGHPQRALWCLTFLPAPARRLGVTVVERGRQAGFSVRRLLGPVAA